MAENAGVLRLRRGAVMQAIAVWGLRTSRTVRATRAMWGLRVFAALAMLARRATRVLFLAVLGIELAGIGGAWAGMYYVTASEELNFGTFTILNTELPAVLALAANPSGNTSVCSGIAEQANIAGLPSGAGCGSLEITKGNNGRGENVVFHFGSIGFNVPSGCEITFTPQADIQYTIPKAQVDIFLDFGGKITISGNCPAGTYTGSGICSYSQGSVAVRASVTINRAAEVTKLDDMDFGTFVSPATPGTITIRPDGGYQSTGIVFVGGAVLQPAQFRVRAAAGSRGTVSATASPLLALSGTGELEVDGVAWAGEHLNGDELSIGSSGFEDVSVGATLHVPAEAAPDVYSGTIQFVYSY